MPQKQLRNAKGGERPLDWTKDIALDLTHAQKRKYFKKICINIKDNNSLDLNSLEKRCFFLSREVSTYR